MPDQALTVFQWDSALDGVGEGSWGRGGVDSFACSRLLSGPLQA